MINKSQFANTFKTGGSGFKKDETKTSNETQKDSQDTTDTLQDLLGTANQSSPAINSYNQKADDYSKNMSEFRSYLQSMAGSIFSEIKKNPLETDWGKGILDYYGVLGDKSANAANAEGAAENSGNIDSYAAANAEKQRISKLGQGISAISGMSNDRFSNMLSVLTGIGVNTNSLFETEGQHSVGTAADLANSLYSTDAASTAEYNDLIVSMFGGDTGSVVPNYEDTKKWITGLYDDRKYATDTAYNDDDLWAEILKELKETPEFANNWGYIQNIINDIQADHAP